MILNSLHRLGFGPGLRLKRAKARFFFILALLPQTALAQTHEFFQLEWLEPPQGSSTQARSSYDLDSHTQAPERVNLEENFFPPVGVHKRQYVFDAIIRAQNELSLAPAPNTWSRALPALDPNALPNHRILGITHHIAAGERLVLPSSSPYMRIQSCSVHENNQPSTALTLEWNDDADLYSLMASHAGVFEVLCHTYSPLDDTTPASYEQISQIQPSLNNIDQDLKNYIISQTNNIDWINAAAASSAPLAQLAREFFSFESTALNHSNDDLLSTILIQKKGLCRHRAFAFVLIAQAWGYRARFVRNEAHAFAEIYNNEKWLLVELGGQADSIQTSSPHFSQSQPPQDNNYNHHSDNIITNNTNSNPQQLSRPSADFVLDAPFNTPLRRDGVYSLSGKLINSKTHEPISNTVITLTINYKNTLQLTLASSKTDRTGRTIISFRMPPDAAAGPASLDLTTPEYIISF